MAMGRRLKRARLAKGYSLRDVEKLAGISASTVSKAENDQINGGLRIDSLHKLALCYGASMDYILNDTILVPKEEQAQVECVILDAIVSFEQRFDIIVSSVILVRSVDGFQLANLYLLIEEGLADGRSDE